MPSLFSILACLGRRFAATIFLFSVFGRLVMLLHIRHFNSCSLREERSTWYLYKMNVATFQFSLPREERCCIPKVVHGLLAISILAPYVGSGGCYFKKFFFQRNFNSRSLRGERFVLGFLTGLTAIISILASCVGSDDNRRNTHILRIEFQFSLPARGAIDSRCQLALQDIVSIHAPRVESEITEFLLQVLQLISILAPCVGSDQRSPTCHPSCHYFNSRFFRGERYD